MVIAVINNKGGTGKTTTSVCLCAALALEGYRILLADMDSQASASFSLGVRWNDLAPSAADILFHGRDIHSVIRPSGVSGLDLITAEMEMASADLILADRPGREFCLLDALKPVRDQYDFIILDCPPSLSMLSVSALMASDSFIVPVVPEYLALEGLASLMDAVRRMRAGMGLKASLAGILLTMVNPSLKTMRDITGIVREYYGDQVFETEIRRDVRLGEAPSFSRTIFEFAPESRGAQAYRLLAREFVKRATDKKAGE